jgi:hypothetical protein
MRWYLSNVNKARKFAVYLLMCLSLNSVVAASVWVGEIASI